jgi:addiction module RelE/StbE family toxin
MRIDWSEPARNDLRAIKAYIANDSPTNAGRFLEQLVASVDRLSEFPESGRRLHATTKGLRELIFRDYRIIYRPEPPERVLIIAVIHGNRALAKLISRPPESD